MKQCVTVLCCAIFLFLMIVPGFAQELPDTIEIRTVEDLQSVAENPTANFILMNDLDLSGVEWFSPDFSGTFDGNGHSLLNLYLSHPGPTKPESYDGNLLSYETDYVGLFATMQNATVKNLNLVNLRGLVEIDSPCFFAGIAGYFQESTISNCTVTGTLELRAHDRMFGIGGIAGFGGIGLIENCNVNVTLICTDTDAATKDEQFLGGIYATGFIDVKDCIVTIDGYGSEHGYAHNGGIVGMYMQQPYGMKISGKLTGNKVYGKITFFEDNRDRRAYCRPIAGETLAFSHSTAYNKYEFERDERKDYDIELRPEMCADPTYTEVLTDPGCESFGYTTYRCDSCGYTYTDHYTLYRHTVTNWQTVLPATEDAEGISEGSCDLCGVLQQRTDPVLEPVPTEATQAATQPEVTEPTSVVPEKIQFPVIPVTLGAAFVAALLVLLLRPRKQRKGKFQK